EDLLGAEEGRRVFLVRIALESRIRIKRGVDPLPDVTDHLTTSDRTVAGRQRSDVDRVGGAIIEIRALGCRRVVAPWESTLLTRRRIERRRHFPFGLRW